MSPFLFQFLSVPVPVRFLPGFCPVPYRISALAADTDLFYHDFAREYGSGGRLIGQKLAEMLNISFYDKEIISLAAEESGLSEEFMRQHDQKKKPLSFVHNIHVRW